MEKTRIFNPNPLVAPGRYRLVESKLLRQKTNILKSIIFFLFFYITITAQNKPVGSFEHKYFTDNSYDGFCFGQIFTLQLNQDNTYILVKNIENDVISEPEKIVGLYTYNENILTLQTPTIQIFKVNKKMTKLKSVEKTEAFGKKIWEIYLKK